MIESINLGSLFGINVITVPDELCKQRKQFRFPRSKKSRIRNKWAKRPENSREQNMAFFLNPSDICRINGKLAVLPKGALKLIR